MVGPKVIIVSVPVPFGDLYRTRYGTGQGRDGTGTGLGRWDGMGRGARQYGSIGYTHHILTLSEAGSELAQQFLQHGFHLDIGF